MKRSGARLFRLNAGWICALLTLPAIAGAEVKPATVRVADEKVWVGQRAAFFVELRAPGSFVGAAGFSLPEIPRTVIVKSDNPVVSSEEIGGESYFVQTHRFMLFSQAPGTLEIPSFKVRFSHREGFTGPAIDREATVPSASIEIQQPPGSENLGFVITTERFEVTQTWDPEPGKAEQGAISRRTIAQEADRMTGMALFPPPTGAPGGVRIYPGQPEVTDHTERGDLRAERRDTLTYVFQQPGVVTIPAIKYVWWNPAKSELSSATVPAATFEITALPAAGIDQPAEKTPHWYGWLALGLFAAGVIVRQRHNFHAWGRKVWRALRPPDRVAARKLLRACRRNSVDDAEAAWFEWLDYQPHPFAPGPQMFAATVELHRCRYGPGHTTWRGEAFENAFRQYLARRASSSASREELPRLNPAPPNPA